jgi:Holliday junction resolvasome RuvABC endonuclease subunit
MMERSKSEYIILTNDPSIVAWGWVVMTTRNNIIEAGCIKTAPEQKKRRIRKSDDRTRRINDINAVLLSLIKKYNIEYIIAEMPHGSQSASAAIMIGIVLGMLQTISDCLNIPIEYYSEGDSKKCLLGKLSATKDETKQAIDKLYDVPWTGIGYKDEAIADAVSIFHVASKESTTLKIMSKC